jgi:hypothetical protein
MQVLFLDLLGFPGLVLSGLAIIICIVIALSGLAGFPDLPFPDLLSCPYKGNKTL